MRIYRDILKESFILTLKNKYFWFFGLFASLVGISSEYEFFFRGLNGDTGGTIFYQYKRFVSTGVFNPGVFNNIINLFKTDAVAMMVIILLGLIILALTIFILWLSVASQVAIVNNSAKNILGKKASFKDGIVAGTKNFWSVLSLNIIIKMIMSIAFLIIGIPFFFDVISFNVIISNLLYIVLFIIFVPIGVVTSFIVKYAIAYIVIKEEKLLDSLKLGWKLFQKNWLVSIEMAFILFFVSLLAVLTIALATLILSIPLLFTAFLFNYLFSSFGFWIIFILGILVLIFVFMIGGAIISSFQIISWTKFFIDLSGRGVTSKISRIVERWGK
jgi:hypothetical protein